MASSTAVPRTATRSSPATFPPSVPISARTASPPRARSAPCPTRRLAPSSPAPAASTATDCDVVEKHDLASEEPLARSFAFAVPSSETLRAPTDRAIPLIARSLFSLQRPFEARAGSSRFFLTNQYGLGRESNQTG